MGIQKILILCLLLLFIDIYIYQSILETDLLELGSRVNTDVICDQLLLSSAPS